MFFKDYIKTESKDCIYLLAHGFLGHTQDLFCSRLTSYLKSEKLNYFAFDFLGHGQSGGEFANLYQMLDQYTTVFNDLKQKYPNNEIVPIGFSQGGAIVLKFLSRSLQIRKAILFAPLSIPSMLIEDRLSIEDKDLIKTTGKITKDFGKDRIKELNKEWLDSYSNFLNIEDIKQIKTDVKIFFAGKDQIIDKIQNEFLKQNLAQFQAVTIQDADHIFNQDESWITISKHFK